jgi:hypothetical protein
MPGLAIHARTPVLRRSATGVRARDLAIIENIASLPLNVAARDVLYEVLDGRDALFFTTTIWPGSVNSSRTLMDRATKPRGVTSRSMISLGDVNWPNVGFARPRS